MQVRILRRRECGAGWATDLLLPRCLAWSEVEALAQEWSMTLVNNKLNYTENNV